MPYKAATRRVQTRRQGTAEGAQTCILFLKQVSKEVQTVNICLQNQAIKQKE